MTLLPIAVCIGVATMAVVADFDVVRTTGGFGALAVAHYLGFRVGEFSAICRFRRVADAFVGQTELEETK